MYPYAVVWLTCCPWFARDAERRLTSHEKLRVRVVVDVQLQPLGALDLLEEVGQRLGLRRVAGRRATEVLRARVSRGAGTLPLVRPVAVDVVAEAAGARRGLAILAPHAVARLRVLEACCRTRRQRPSEARL